MIENPFLRPPQVEGPFFAAWQRGFVFGFQGPPASVPHPAIEDPEASNAFDQGVLAGQDAAINGFPVQADCVDLREEPPTPADLVPAGFEAILTIVEVVKHGLVGGIGSGLLGIVDLFVRGAGPFHYPTGTVSGQAKELAGVLYRQRDY